VGQFMLLVMVMCDPNSISIFVHSQTVQRWVDVYREDGAFNWRFIDLNIGDSMFLVSVALLDVVLR